MANGVPKQSVKEILGDFSSLDSAKELFSELNYDIARDSLSRRDWGKIANEALAEDPQIIATHGDFHVIYGRVASDKLLITPQRAVINTLLQDHPYALFLFSNEDQMLWHFVNVKLAIDQDDERNKDTKKRRLFRRITIRENERRLRTAIERLSMLDLAVIQPELFGIPPLTIQSRHDEAFDVEAVTKKFYGDYVEIFGQLQASLKSQTKDQQWAHDYALQFLNRTMFLYFVQRKGWLADDSEFLETLWKTYDKSDEAKDTFFEKWLKVLFFEAFNNRKNLLNTAQRAYLPEEIRKALWDAPYLNGGLFRENKLDTKHDFSISDRQFRAIFNVFQHYNFTISEDSPLDQEVAVDPEMIGKVYEGLVNVSENVDERGEAGIFYTPRTEIDLMCRLSIVDNLANHLSQQHKNLLYEAVFSLDQEDKEQADKALAEAKLWPEVEKRLNEVTLLDPACGSGSFLVGMLYVLNDLLERAEKQRGQLSDSYERKKRIIGQSLYGVDVMDWACHVAELRLWLSLIVNAEFTKEQLTIREEPLLPHFSFNVRCGDSLVQEVGGVDMAHRRGVMELSQNMKRRLKELKDEKSKFYSSDKTGKFKSLEALEQQEVLVFRELLQDRIKAFDDEAKKLMRVQAEEQAYQQRSLLTGELEGPSKQFTLERERREKQITALKEETKSLDVVLNSIRSRATVPFVWDISFAEIFSGDSHGFDIVIGNPPYVERHKIRDPNGSFEPTLAERKAYMQKLAKSVYSCFPRYFGLSRAGKVSHPISLMSDLYVYFYFHGLSLLNGKGSFCFITSNSWLDVGYGKDLQEFLLKRCHVKLVIDNKVKRTFKPADVNTIIVLFGAPVDSKVPDDVSMEKQAKFVMFYVPFEEALHPVVFEEIAEFTKKTSRPEYRVFPIEQARLLDDGSEIPKGNLEQEKAKGALIRTTKYIGNRWGGRYLRAPDIFSAIWEHPLMRPMAAWAQARLGVTTGANDFFFIRKVDVNKYLAKFDDQELQITLPKEFTTTVLRTSSECNNTSFYGSRSPYRLLLVGPDCRNPLVIEYIHWGVELGVHKRPFFKRKKCWYDLSDVPRDRIAVSEIMYSRYFFVWNAEGSALNKNFYGYVPKGIDHELLWALLNFSFTFLYFELSSRKPGAGASGIGVRVANALKILDVNSIDEDTKRNLRSTGQKLLDQPIQDIWDTVLQPERRALDALIFDVLGLPPSDREELYHTLVDLVKSRMKKAQSVKQSWKTR